MSKCIILQHVAHEGPGRIVPVFADFGIPCEVIRLDRGEPLPRSQREVRLLISMGGPMSITDVGQAQYPFLAAELDFLKQRIDADLPTLGICLGAQLIAHAAGAKVAPNMRPSKAPDAQPTPAPEIGFLPVTFPFPGGTEPIVMGLHDGAVMFHWHFDAFELPRLPAPANPPPGPPPPTGNALLSSSRACKNQAFRFKTKIFGFQYHMEMDRNGIEAMLVHAADDVRKVHGEAGFDVIRRDTAAHYGAYERLGNRLLRNIVQFLKVS